MTCLRWVDAKKLDKPFVKDLAAGRYQKVIKDVQKEIKSLFAILGKGNIDAAISLFANFGDRIRTKWQLARGSRYLGSRVRRRLRRV